MKLRVVATKPLAQDVLGVTLASLEGEDLPPWTPGAHLEFELESGKIRHYSLCGDPCDRDRYAIAVLHERAGRGGSAEIHHTWRQGHVVRARPPRNNFELKAGVKSTFIAGGIGVTPILSQARAAAAQGRDWKVFYGGKTRSTMALVDELLVLDPDRVVLCPQDVSGLLDLTSILHEAAGGDIYACGPAPMLGALKERCEGAGIELYIERFSASTDLHCTSAGGTPFDLELRRSGTKFTVPADQTILDTLLQAGQEVFWSCREGICGTCATAVLEGVPDHRDDFLSDKEKSANDQIMICVSRCKGRKLVLDI